MITGWGDFFLKKHTNSLLLAVCLSCNIKYLYNGLRVDLQNSRKAL